MGALAPMKAGCAAAAEAEAGVPGRAKLILASGSDPANPPQLVAGETLTPCTTGDARPGGVSP